MYLLSANPGKRNALLAEVDRFGRARVPTSQDLDRRARPASAGAGAALWAPPRRARSCIRPGPGSGLCARARSLPYLDAVLKGPS